MSEDTIWSIILSLVILGMFTLFFYNPLERFLRRKSELKEEPALLDQKEPHPFRNLTPEELDKLNSMIKSANNFSPIYILGFIYILNYVFTKLDPRLPDATKNYPFIPYLLLLVPALFTFLIVYKNREKAKKMKSDLDSKVFLATGNVYKEEHHSKYSSELSVTIRGIMFDGKQKLNTDAKLFDTVNQDQEVTVEYSPNSKYIWKIQV